MGPFDLQVLPDRPDLAKNMSMILYKAQEICAAAHRIQTDLLALHTPSSVIKLRKAQYETYGWIGATKHLLRKAAHIFENISRKALKNFAVHSIACKDAIVP